MFVYNVCVCVCVCLCVCVWVCICVGLRALEAWHRLVVVKQRQRACLQKLIASAMQLQRIVWGWREFVQVCVCMRVCMCLCLCLCLCVALRARVRAGEHQKAAFHEAEVGTNHPSAQ